MPSFRVFALLALAATALGSSLNSASRFRVNTVEVQDVRVPVTNSGLETVNIDVVSNVGAYHRHVVGDTLKGYAYERNLRSFPVADLPAFSEDSEDIDTNSDVPSALDTLRGLKNPLSGAIAQAMPSQSAEFVLLLAGKLVSLGEAIDLMLEVLSTIYANRMEIIYANRMVTRVADAPSPFERTFNSITFMYRSRRPRRIPTFMDGFNDAARPGLGPITKTCICPELDALDEVQGKLSGSTNRGPTIKTLAFVTGSMPSMKVNSQTDWETRTLRPRGLSQTRTYGTNCLAASISRFVLDFP